MRPTGKPTEACPDSVDDLEAVEPDRTGICGLLAGRHQKVAAALFREALGDEGRRGPEHYESLL
jgi:hypothetical protein